MHDNYSPLFLLLYVLIFIRIHHIIVVISYGSHRAVSGSHPVIKFSFIPLCGVEKNMRIDALLFINISILNNCAVISGCKTIPVPACPRVIVGSQTH